MSQNFAPQAQNTNPGELHLYCLQAAPTRTAGGRIWTITLSSTDEYGNPLNAGVSGFQFSFTTQDDARAGQYQDGKVYVNGVGEGRDYEAPQAAQARLQREQQAASAQGGAPQGLPAGSATDSTT